MARTAATKKRAKKGGAGATGDRVPMASSIGHGRRREVLGVVLLGTGITLMLALFSFTPRDKVLLQQGQVGIQNLIGPVGHYTATGLMSAIGIGAFVVAAAILAAAIACFVRRRVHLTVVEAAGYVLLVVFGATLAHLTFGELRPLSHAPGGVIGAVAGEMLRSWMNTTGAVITSSVMALLSFMVASDFTIARIVGPAGRGVLEVFGRLVPSLLSSWEGAKEVRAERALAREERRIEKQARRQARQAEREERQAAREAMRRERISVLREEGTVEADETGLILLTTEDETVSASPSSRRLRRGLSRSSTETTDPREDAIEPASSKARESNAKRSVGAYAAPVAPGRTSFTNGRTLEQAPHLAISPADDRDVPRSVSMPDPLADPTWADPEWVGGLFEIGASSASTPPSENGDVLTISKPEHDARPTNSSPRPEVVRRAPRARSSQDTKANGTEPAQSTQEHCSGPPKSEARSSDLPEMIDPSLEVRRQETKPEASDSEPTIVAPKPALRPAKRSGASQETFAFTTHGDKFVLPSLDFLTTPAESTTDELDKEALVETARKLTEKLQDFGIVGEVVQIRPGPVITMYEFRPGPGVKISKIQSLSDDLAMAMEALRVRIVAPIPGKNAVGIEVPNVKRQMVSMREILEQDGFLQSKSKLTLGMGKNIEGDPVIVDLAKMPHLLIAGTTGSGKSVAVNGMITSMLYKATPEEVRFIMIDPKVLELKLYEGIPHLLLPVVTDPVKAALALRWATEEMDRRYHQLADLNVRDLATFNRKVSRLQNEWEARQADIPPLPPIDSLDGNYAAQESLRRQHEERWLADPPPPERLPLLVIVIDELADLMMVASREVETYIARLAQKARAAGIHLLVATQRPSTDVLTGVIKINFPARISFRVASRHDSQTIINEPGAEKLLGNGDMLIIPPGQSEPMRAHGAFLSEGEIERVVEHLKTQGKPVYDESILQPREENGSGSGADEEDDSLDPKWDEALSILSDRDTISVSWIQRRLAIGYNRAARMIEKMEREGIVGPADGSKPRDVLMGGPHM